MIEDTPNYWGKPLSEWYDTNLSPLTQELGRTLVAKSCKVPNCSHVATWDDYCDQHLVEIDEAYQEWQQWKEKTSFKRIDTYFIPYEEFRSE